LGIKAAICLSWTDKFFVMSDHAKTDTPMQKGLKGLGCLILVCVFLLYPMSYLVGRLTGFGGMVVDNTVGISFSANGEVSAAMGGGILPMKKAGRGGIFLRHVNGLYKPLRQLDYKFTDEEFYWFFFDPD